MKYSTPKGVGIVRGEQKTSRECYTAALKGSNTCAAIMNQEELAPGKPGLIRGTPAEELELVPLLNSDKQVSIRTMLGAKDRAELIDFLRTNADVFIWSH